ncbi:MAG: hypothetical protein ACXVB9_01030 [Bdellovibrionota bacterium]
MRVLLFLILSLAAHAANPPPFAKVLLVSGAASLEPLHTTLQVGMELSEGERITVMSGSKLRLKLANGAVIEVGPHSELLLKNNAAGAPFLRMPHGELLVVTRAGDPLELRTGQLRLFADAKTFFVSQELDKPAYICVCDGKLRAKWALGEANLSAKRHESPVWIYPSKTAAVPAHEKPRHDDEQIRALRAFL